MSADATQHRVSILPGLLCPPNKIVLQKSKPHSASTRQCKTDDKRQTTDESNSKRKSNAGGELAAPAPQPTRG